MQPVILATISLDAMAGGLEKNIIFIANYLSEHGYDVRLVTFDLDDAHSFYKINEKVHWHKIGIGKPHAPISFLNRMKLIRKIRDIIGRLKFSLHRPIIICFHHGILVRFFSASFFNGSRIICSERNSLSIYKHISKSKWNLNFFLLSFVQKIVVQFPEYRQTYPFWMRKQIMSIHNSVSPSGFSANTDMADENGRFKILTVGRLSAQKQQDTLINAFSQISDHFPTWDLFIVGDGELHSKLKNLIGDEKLRDRVFLVGKSINVYDWMGKSHLFCLPSKWEGFPNALAEALAHGLPSVGFANCEGVNKLIVNNENGLLADGDNNAQTLGVSLSALMESSLRREMMGRAAIDSVSQYFPEKILKQWEQLLLTVIEER